MCQLLHNTQFSQSDFNLSERLTRRICRLNDCSDGKFQRLLGRLFYNFGHRLRYLNECFPYFFFFFFLLFHLLFQSTTITTITIIITKHTCTNLLHTQAHVQFHNYTQGNAYCYLQVLFKKEETNHFFKRRKTT